MNVSSFDLYSDAVAESYDLLGFETNVGLPGKPWDINPKDVINGVREGIKIAGMSREMNKNMRQGITILTVCHWYSDNFIGGTLLLDGKTMTAIWLHKMKNSAQFCSPQATLDMATRWHNNAYPSQD